MLAQNFKSAADLELTDVEHSALITVLHMLERKEIGNEKHSDQNALWMHSYFLENHCGTVACLCGWANKISHKVAFPELNISDQFHSTDLLDVRLSRATKELFWINTEYRSCDPTNEQAATALRSYLTTGDARWDLALA